MTPLTQVPKCDHLPKIIIKVLKDLRSAHAENNLSQNDILRIDEMLQDYKDKTSLKRDGLGNLDNMEQFLSDKLPRVMPLPGS